MARTFYLLLLFVPGMFMDLRGQEASISGVLALDSSWAKKVYISRIPEFNQMFKASGKLIVAQGDIDHSGNFKISFPASAQETLFRLNIIKTTDPVSTLIIGGKDQNHLFFIAKSNNQIYLKASDSILVDQSKISGSEANTELIQLLARLNNGDLERDSLKNQLVAAVRKSKSQLVGLLAVYSSFGLNETQKNTIRKSLKKYDGNNPYGISIFEEYKIRNNDVILWILLALFILLLTGLLLRRLKKLRMEKIKSLLSQREISIVQFVIQGKSNKEIASDLNIELSTVKTHVNNIYAKLNIATRKELQRFKEIFEPKDNTHEKLF